MNITLYDNINEIYGEEKCAREEIYGLWQDCFGDSKEYTDFYFNWKVKDNRILTIYKEKALCSMLHLNPYLLSVRGKEVPANYIVGVATKKEERRQGLMKILLEKALHQMYLEKMPFTYLMPAAEAIYTPYDFRVVYEQEPWNEIMKAMIQDLREKTETSNENKDITVRSLNPKDIDRMKGLTDFCNDQLSKDCDIYVYRTPYYYERLIHEMISGYGEVLVCYRQEQILGYLSYMAEEAIYITEMITNNKDKEAVFESFAAYLKKNIQKGMYEDKEHKTTAIMARIVDFKTFVKDISATEEIQIVMEVSDAILEENNGIYQLKFTKEGCHITETEEEPEVTLNIAEAAELFFGRLQWEEFINTGGTSRTAVHDKAILDKLDKINSYSQVYINDVV
jgi:predicted acetyltransferase